MKNLKKILIYSVLVFGINSCTEEKILDLSPINNISEKEAFSTPALIESSMNGVYNAAAIGQYTSTSQNGGRGYIWGAAFVQQGDARGEDVVSNATFFQKTYDGSHDQTTLNNVYYWSEGYRLINRCNLMIEGVDIAVASGVISATVGNDYIGQARFLRAITHFELLNFFSRAYNFSPDAAHLGIPYREIGINTQSEIDSENLKPRNTVADCYTKILNDLDFAENNISSTLISKASKNAAIAFKTRVYLHKRDWANVITEGLKLNGKRTLTPAPSGPFIVTNNLSNTESIFSIQHSSTSNPGANGALVSLLKSRAFLNISPIIWRNPNWLADDKRREEGVMVTTVSGAKVTNKYNDAVNLSDAAPVIRYAEVLLNMAEANTRLTTPNLPTALTLLNTVRNRSLANPLTQAYTSTTLNSQLTMLNAILIERRIEFLLEGRRWSDIQRLQNDNLAPINGIPGKLANATVSAALYVLGAPYTPTIGVPAVPSSNFKFLWPIPQIEINANPTLAKQQNPGWE